MNSGFYHKDEIKNFYKEFPLLLKGNLEDNFEIEGDITIDELSNTTNSKNNFKISENVIKIPGKKDVKLTFTEDNDSAKLTIKIGEKPVGTITKMGRMNSILLADLVMAVNDECKSQA
jgi:hypothetical protein